ncbi:zinc finger, C3HC4 type (RING finger) domain-containing protein [Toxoplasma gondii RUB]|uniref:E3 ubiquitin-protein ligase listerin n=1 Tax=Toxoplasma gondii RUB TaxID=935652 RepID=A0A086LNN6_TOXGO|nr:zinc finger, C3HC4 type (RING finger) domain-containing protein [Toxoplasma gondii RUB]
MAPNEKVPATSASRGKQLTGKQLKRQLRGEAASSARSAQLVSSLSPSVGPGAPGGATQLAAIFAHFAQASTASSAPGEDQGLSASLAASSSRSPSSVAPATSSSACAKAPGAAQRSRYRETASEAPSSVAAGRGALRQADAGEQQQIDDIHRALVKLTKRDSVTRLKGLQELEFLLHASRGSASPSSDGFSPSSDGFSPSSDGLNPPSPVSSASSPVSSASSPVSSASSPAFCVSASSSSSSSSHPASASSPDLSSLSPATASSAASAAGQTLSDEAFLVIAEAILPQFVYVYGRLAVWDSERRIRAGVNRCLSLIASRARKLLGPHLRAMLPLWWMSSHDDAAEVALAAQEALDFAFPPFAASSSAAAPGAASSSPTLFFRGFVGHRARLAAAFDHCREALFSEYFQLLACNPEGLNALAFGAKSHQKKSGGEETKSPHSGDEAEDRYDRTVSCVLLALGHLARLLVSTSAASSPSSSPSSEGTNCVLSLWRDAFEPLLSVGNATSLVRFLAPSTFRLSVRRAALASLLSLLSSFARAGLPFPLPPVASAAVFRGSDLQGEKSEKSEKSEKKASKQERHQRHRDAQQTAVASALTASSVAASVAPGCGGRTLVGDAAENISASATERYIAAHAEFPYPLLPRAFVSTVFSALADRPLCASRLPACWSLRLARSSEEGPQAREGHRDGGAGDASLGRSLADAQVQCGSAGVLEVVTLLLSQCDIPVRRLAPTCNTEKEDQPRAEEERDVEQGVLHAYKKMISHQLILFFPKLLAAIRHGGYSSSPSFYDALLPLLAAMPGDLLLHSKEGRDFLFALLGDLTLLLPLVGVSTPARDPTSKGKTGKEAGSARTSARRFDCSVADHKYVGLEKTPGERTDEGEVTAAGSNEGQDPVEGKTAVEKRSKNREKTDVDVAEARVELRDWSQPRRGRAVGDKAAGSVKDASLFSRSPEALHPGARTLLTSHFTVLLFLLQKRILPALPRPRVNRLGDSAAAPPPSPSSAGAVSALPEASSLPHMARGTANEPPALTQADMRLLRLAVARAVCLPLCFLFLPVQGQRSASQSRAVRQVRRLHGATEGDEKMAATGVLPGDEEEERFWWHREDEKRAYEVSLPLLVRWFVSEIFRRNMQGATECALAPLLQCMQDHVNSLLFAAVAGIPGKKASARDTDRATAISALGALRDSLCPLFAALASADPGNLKAPLVSASSPSAASSASSSAAPLCGGAGWGAGEDSLTFYAGVRSLHAFVVSSLLRLLRDLLHSAQPVAGETADGEELRTARAVDERRPAATTRDGCQRWDLEGVNEVVEALRQFLEANMRSRRPAVSSDKAEGEPADATQAGTSFAEEESRESLILLVGDKRQVGELDDGNGDAPDLAEGREGVVQLLASVVRNCVEEASLFLQAQGDLELETRNEEDRRPTRGVLARVADDRERLASIGAHWRVARLLVDKLLLPLFRKLGEIHACATTGFLGIPGNSADALVEPWRLLVSLLLPSPGLQGGEPALQFQTSSGPASSSKRIEPSLLFLHHTVALGLLHRLWKALRGLGRQGAGERETFGDANRSTGEEGRECVSGSLCSRFNVAEVAAETTGSCSFQVALERCLLASASLVLSAPLAVAPLGSDKASVAAWSPRGSQLLQMVTSELLPEYVELVTETLTHASQGSAQQAPQQEDAEERRQHASEEGATAGDAAPFLPLISLNSEEAVLRLTEACLSALHRLYVCQNRAREVLSSGIPNVSSASPVCDGEQSQAFRDCEEAAAQTQRDLLRLLLPLNFQTVLHLLLSRVPAPSESSLSTSLPSSLSRSSRQAPTVAALSGWLSGLFTFHLLQHGMPVLDGDGRSQMAAASETFETLLTRLPKRVLDALLSLLRACVTFPASRLYAALFELSTVSLCFQERQDADEQDESGRETGNRKRDGNAEGAEAFDSFENNKEEPLFLRASAVTVERWAGCLSLLARPLLSRVSTRQSAHKAPGDLTAPPRAMSHALDILVYLLRLHRPSGAETDPEHPLGLRSSPSVLEPHTCSQEKGDSLGLRSVRVTSLEGFEPLSPSESENGLKVGLWRCALTHACCLAFLDSWGALCGSAARDASGSAAKTANKERADSKGNLKPNAEGHFEEDSPHILLTRNLLEAAQQSRESGHVDLLLDLFLASSRVSVEPELGVSSLASRAAAAIGEEATACAGGDASVQVDSSPFSLLFPPSFSFRRQRERTGSLVDLAMPALVSTVLSGDSSAALSQPEVRERACGARGGPAIASFPSTSLFALFFSRLLRFCEAEGQWETLLPFSATSIHEEQFFSLSARDPPPGVASAVGPCMLRSAVSSALRSFLLFSGVSSRLPSLSPAIPRGGTQGRDPVSSLAAASAAATSAAATSGCARRDVADSKAIRTAFEFLRWLLHASLAVTGEQQQTQGLSANDARQKRATELLEDLEDPRSSASNSQGDLHSLPSYASALSVQVVADALQDFLRSLPSCCLNMQDETEENVRLSETVQDLLEETGNTHTFLLDRFQDQIERLSLLQSQTSADSTRSESASQTARFSLASNACLPVSSTGNSEESRLSELAESEGTLARILSCVGSAFLTVSSVGRELVAFSQKVDLSFALHGEANEAGDMYRDFLAALLERETEMRLLICSLRYSPRAVLPATQKALLHWRGLRPSSQQFAGSDGSVHEDHEERRVGGRQTETDEKEQSVEAASAEDRGTDAFVCRAWKCLEAVDAACGLRLLFRAFQKAEPPADEATVEPGDALENELSDEAFTLEALRLAVFVLKETNRQDRGHWGNRKTTRPASACGTPRPLETGHSVDQGRERESISAAPSMGAVSQILALSVKLVRASPLFSEVTEAETGRGDRTLGVSFSEAQDRSLRLLALSVRLAVLYDEALHMHEAAPAPSSLAAFSSTPHALVKTKTSFSRYGLHLSSRPFCSQFYDDATCRVLRLLCDSLDLSVETSKAASSSAATASPTAVAARICAGLLGCRRSPVQASIVTCLRRYPWFSQPLLQTDAFPPLFLSPEAQSEGRQRRPRAKGDTASDGENRDRLSCVCPRALHGDSLSLLADADLCECTRPANTSTFSSNPTGTEFPLSASSRVSRQQVKQLLQRFDLSLDRPLSPAVDGSHSEGEACEDGDSSGDEERHSRAANRAVARTPGPGLCEGDVFSGSAASPAGSPAGSSSLFRKLRHLLSTKSDGGEGKGEGEDEGDAGECEEMRMVDDVLQAVEPGDGEREEQGRASQKSERNEASQTEETPQSGRSRDEREQEKGDRICRRPKGFSPHPLAAELSQVEEGTAILGWLLQIFTGRVLASQLVGTFRYASCALALASDMHSARRAGTASEQRGASSSSVFFESEEQGGTSEDETREREREQALEDIALGLRGWMIVLPSLLSLASDESDGKADSGSEAAQETGDKRSGEKAEASQDFFQKQAYLPYLQQLLQTAPSQAARARSVLSRATPSYVPFAPPSSLCSYGDAPSLTRFSPSVGSSPCGCRACELLQDVTEMSLVQALVELLFVTFLQLAAEASRFSPRDFVGLQSFVAPSSRPVSELPASRSAVASASRVCAVEPPSVVRWLLPPGLADALGGQCRVVPGDRIRAPKVRKAPETSPGLMAEGDSLWLTRDWREYISREGMQSLATDNRRSDEKAPETVLQQLPLHGLVWDVTNRSFLWLLAAHVYYLLLQFNPEAVRRIWMRCRNGRARRELELFTETYVSSRLMQKEVREASKLAETFDLSLNFDSRQRDLAVTFRDEKGEISVTLNVLFAKNFPLQKSQPHLDLDRIPGVPKRRSSRWLLAAFGAMNRSSLSAGLFVWAANLQHFFEGLEDCPICYSVVHPHHRSLPKKMCATCKYKFHAECIYRWFRTARKTNCPLCQSPF